MVFQNQTCNRYLNLDSILSMVGLFLFEYNINGCFNILKQPFFSMIKNILFNFCLFSFFVNENK